MAKKIALETINDFLYKYNLIENDHRVLPYNDEPKFFYYRCIIDLKNSRTSIGKSLSNLEEAKFKSFFEALERNCLLNTIFSKKSISSKSIRINSLQPEKLSHFSEKQIKNNKKLQFDSNSSFRAILGKEMLKRKSCLIPAQTVYLNYDFKNEIANEPTLRIPNSTGTAGSFSLQDALERGFCEVIERDSIMISFLKKIQLPQIQIDSCDLHIQKICKKLNQYKIELVLLDATIDTKPTTIIAILLDRGENPLAKISVGSKTSFRVNEAITGAIEEATYGRNLIRTRIVKSKNKTNSSKIQSLDERIHFWETQNVERKLSFWLKNHKKKVSDITKNQKNSNSLSKALKILQKMNIQTFYVDITKPSFEKIGYKTTKVIIPHLQQLFFDETLPPYSHRVRNFTHELCAIKNINTDPHPFL